MFAHVSVGVNTSLSPISMLDLAPLSEEPVVIRLQVLGQFLENFPRFAWCHRWANAELACFCRTAQKRTGKIYNNNKNIFNSFLSSNKIWAFSDSVKKCSIFFSQVYVHPCYLPASFPGSYDASWTTSSAQRNSVYLVPKATFPTSAASSVQSPTSRHYRSVSAPKSEASVCAKGMVKPVSAKLAWGLIAIQLQQHRACTRNNLSSFWSSTLLQGLNEEGIQSVLHFE